MARRVITDLTLTHIAAVDRPCQEGAQARLIKRQLPPPVPVLVLKSIDVPPVRGFLEIIASNQLWERRSEANEALWPIMDAIRESLVSIAADAAMSEDQKLTAAAESVTQFMAALRSKWPEIAAEVDETAMALTKSADVAALIKAGIVGKGGSKMDELEKLKAEKAELEKQLAAAKADTATAVAAQKATEGKAEKAIADLAAMTEEKEKTAKSLAELTAKHDESLTIGDKIVKRSEVGVTSFEIIKAQEARVTKAECEKRAGDEFGHLPGTVAEKGALLAHMIGAPEAIMKSFETVLMAAEKISKGAFSQLGNLGDGQRPAGVQKARDDFMGKVNEVMARDKCGKSVAMEKAEREFPAIFKAYQEGDAAATAN